MSIKPLKKILLVDNEPDICTIVQLALEYNNEFTVQSCQSGQEALDQAEAFAPDLILLDMMMPGMDGIATLHELKKRSALKLTPVIFMTAKAQAHEITHYRQMGVIDVISKPFDPVTLAETLRAIWKQQRHE